jgi:hypothetical protein
MTIKTEVTQYFMQINDFLAVKKRANFSLIDSSLLHRHMSVFEFIVIDEKDIKRVFYDVSIEKLHQRNEYI